MKLKKYIRVLFTIAFGIVFFESAAHASEKTQLYCVTELNQYEKLTYLGKNIEVEGDFVNLFANYSGLLIESVYFRLNNEHSLKVNEYVSACPTKNIQVIKRYANKYDDFVVVTNINNISYSNYIVKYNYYFPSFGMRIPFTNRVTYSGVQGVYMPNVFQIFLNFVASQSVR